MAEVRPSRGSVAWIFVLLGPTLTMAFALAESLIRSVVTPGDVSFLILAVVVGSNPLALATPWLLLMLPFGLTGVVAFKLDGRVNAPRFVAVCTAVGATLTLLSAPLFSASPELSMIAESGLAALMCALAARIRLPFHRAALLPRP